MKLERNVKGHEEFLKKELKTMNKSRQWTNQTGQQNQKKKIEGRRKGYSNIMNQNYEKDQNG